MSWALLVFCLLGLLLPSALAAIACADGYICHQDTATGITWVMRDKYILYGPTCSVQCNTALCGSGSFHGCHAAQLVLRDAAFTPIANGLGFNCTRGGCWNSTSSGGATLVKGGNSSLTSRTCYFPTVETHDCESAPGNANCYGERYATVCPCKAIPIEEGCKWTSPPNYPAVAKFPVNPNGTSCIDRINYWRKRACDEGWPECPPCGLPPMVECVACHECANSQAEYDSVNGAHKSFTRCGEMAQGEGGGSTCASVIDQFVAERQVFPDSNGQVVCRGHCGPIVAPGCNTFFWGKAKSSNFHTLNWHACNVDKCNAYCTNPTDNACFTVASSPDVGYNFITSVAVPSPAQTSTTASPQSLSSVFLTTSTTQSPVISSSSSQTTSGHQTTSTSTTSPTSSVTPGASSTTPTSREPSSSAISSTSQPTSGTPQPSSVAQIGPSSSAVVNSVTPSPTSTGTNGGQVKSSVGIVEVSIMAAMIALAANLI